MTLDPHARRFLDMIAMGASPEPNLASRRSALRGLARLGGPKPAASLVVSDLRVPGGADEIGARFYGPTDIEGGVAPGLVFFHGGGFVAGDLDSHDALCRSLAETARCRIVSVDYRLAPEHPYPAALEDGVAAAGWIRDHARELGIDHERLGLAGSSAGGGIAAHVSQEAATRGAPYGLLLLLCPVLDAAGTLPSRSEFAEGYLLDAETMRRDAETSGLARLDPADPLASPLRAPPLRAEPPALIHTAECDLVRDEGIAYAERLLKAGRPVAQTCHPGMIHEFYLLGGVIPAAREALLAIGRDLGEALRAGAAAPATVPGSAKTPSPNARWAAALSRTAKLEARPTGILPLLIEELAARYGEKPAILDERETVSFRELGRRVSRWTRWALARDLGPGTTIGLLMPNRADYLAVWLGITRTGATVALFNTNLRGASLAHCIRVAEPALVLASPDLAEAARDAIGTGDIPVAALDTDLTAALSDLPDGPIAPGECRETTLAERALLIFTSGTTSLPKAANVSHHRVMSWSQWFAGLLDIGPDDRMYDCLPLYHSVGGVVATGATLVGGGAIVMRERFSASRFWDDVVETRCTLFQYIGELCRYLVNAPPHPREREHSLRFCVGNGLRPDIWERFQARFAIPAILEFYASTEGTVSLYNVEGRPGAVGRVPPLMAHRFPAALVALDPETGAPKRGPDGFAIRARPGEPGELLGRASRGDRAAAQRFEGYTQEAESARKLLSDVFAPGDAWMRTGDLMTCDEAGYFFFVDRLGDTFRWKGENVSTTEVADALGRVPGILEATVYGVAVPGAEGRAGMAALVTGPGFDPAGLHATIAGDLPVYARPVFLRLQDGLERTETFKAKKQSLVRDGFDPDRIADPLYVLDPRDGRYRALDREGFAAIAAGARRL